MEPVTTVGPAYPSGRYPLSCRGLFLRQIGHRLGGEKASSEPLRVPIGHAGVTPL